MAITGAATLTPGFGGPLGKVLPEHVAGMIGLPYVGTVFYVDATAGSDTANSGTSQNDAFATVNTAFAAATSGQHDVIIIAPTGGSGRTTEATSINWNKRFTHLIGSAAPSMVNPRAGMSFTSAATSPSFTISENGCIFKNITIAQFNDVNVLVEQTGNENYFGNVHFAGIGNADAGDDTAAVIINFNGGEENTYDGCMIGLDTVARTGANFSLNFASAAGNPRNVFRNCFFTLFGDAEAPRHVRAQDGGTDRWELFDNCIFMDNSDITSATTQTDVFATGSASDQGGALIVKDCMNVSSTGWANTVAGVRIIGQDTNATTLTNYSSGVNPAA